MDWIVGLMVFLLVLWLIIYAVRRSVKNNTPITVNLDDLAGETAQVIPYERLAETYIANPLSFIHAFKGISCIVRGTISRFNEIVGFIDDNQLKVITGSFIVFEEYPTARMVFHFEPDSSSDLFKLKIGDCVDVKGTFDRKTNPFTDELLFKLCSVQKVNKCKSRKWFA
ncbi:MAG: hypothetical protein IJU07_05700 [Synergistaceae bacterium]|nr:hypothetical protein [Synergistaceae bacterium]